MLLKKAVQARIAAGEVTLAFRCWKRPTVKAGGSLRTAVGVLAIERVDPVALSAITAAEARQAGYESLAALRAELDGRRSEGAQVYRIAFRLAGADPRVALREKGRLTKAEAAELRARLDRFDARSAAAPWASRTLHLIGARDGITAAEIAADLGLDKPDLKRKVRKLKELGLTESLPSGYRLSPRGRSLLKRIGPDAGSA